MVWLLTTQSSRINSLLGSFGLGAKMSIDEAGISAEALKREGRARVKKKKVEKEEMLQHQLLRLLQLKVETHLQKRQQKINQLKLNL